LNIALISTPFLQCPPRNYGGLERIVWDLARGLISLNQKVVVFAAQGSQQLPGGVMIDTIPCENSTQVDWLGQERNMWKVYDPMLKDFDIVHGHNWFGFEYASKVRNMELNVCHTHHGAMNTAWWCRKRPAFKTNIIGISEFMKKQYDVYGFNAKYVYNGIDLDEYKFSKSHGDRLLYVGRLAEFKQPHIAIEVAKSLNMPIDIVGGSFVDNTSYMEKIIGMSDGENVKVYLDASQEKKIELYQNAKCLLFPSNMDEPFGLVAIEAMACGTPVVALQDGAIPELITAESGSVCKPKNEKESILLLGEAVKRLNCKAIDCRSRAEMFSKEVMAQNYLDLYNNILKRNEW
jgi:glycosyltransferase involved in cell wall biosynthesis